MSPASSSRKRRPVGRWLLAVFFVLVAVGAVAANQLGYVEKVRNRLYGRTPRLSAGDFPAGVMAPTDDVVMIPARPIVLGVVPRGSIASLLWAAGDADHPGLFRTGYAIDVRVVTFPREEELRRALIRGADNGGVDLAVVPVSTLAMSASLLRDAAPRVVMLQGRSRGHEVLVGKGITRLQELSGKRIGVEDRSAAWYLVLWGLSRAGLSLRDVQVVDLDDALGAGNALREKRFDAVAGIATNVGPVAQEVGATRLTSTADAPHLLASVVVARGDFAARYPDAIRRFIRGALDANAQVNRDPGEAARVLGDRVPELGDPTEAISSAPPSTLKDNLAFFGVQGESPVTYRELFESAAALNQKLFGAPPAPDAEDTTDLGALRYVASQP